MRLGLALGVAGLDLAEHARIAAAADAAGADSLGVGEAHHDSFVAATAVAAATSRARVITGVTTWARPPVLTAMAAMSVDEVAGGRFALGLGTMPPSWNRDFFGLDPARPLERMREYVAVVRAALGGGPVHHEGERFRVAGWRRLGPPPPREVPVHLAVTLPGMARLAGSVADGVLVNGVVTARWLAEHLLPALDEGAAGRARPEVGQMVRVAVHDGSAAGRQRARDAVRGSLALYRDVPYFHTIAAHAGVGPDDDAAADLFGIAGEPDEVRERLAVLPGVDWVELAPPSGLPPAELREQYAALVEVVRREHATTPR